MLFAVTLVAAFSTILAQMSFPRPVMLPQCMCSTLSNCIQQQQQQLTTCSLSPTCTALLSNNNQSAVTSCLTQRFNRIQTEETCLQNAIGLGNMGCTNSSSAPKLPSYAPTQGNSNDYDSYDYTDTTGTPSPLGQYYTCVQACLNSSSNSNNDGSSCPSNLNCALDMNAIAQAGNAMWAAMQTCESQNQNTDPNVSDCQCLANAGVTINCQPTQLFILVVGGGRSRRAAYEKMLKP
jgi:hypothetical protein